MELLPRRPSCASIPPFNLSTRVRDWSQTAPCDHLVQFYRTDDYLIECLAGYFADALWNGESAVVIASASHRNALHERLRVKGVNVASSVLQRRYFAEDVGELLKEVVANGSVAPERFQTRVGELVAKAARSGKAVRAFSEMGALASVQAGREAALELEELWDRLGERHTLRLFCAYPTAATDAADPVWAQRICAAHSHVVSLSG